MKVYYKNLIKSYSGNFDDLIYCYNPRLKCYYARSHSPRRKTAQNQLYADIAKNMKRLSPSPEYRQDLTNYVNAYNSKKEYREHPLNNWYNAFTKLMWNMAKTYSLNGIPLTENSTLINLTTLTREDIIEYNLPCRTVKQAIEAGLLPVVPGYEFYNNEI